MESLTRKLITTGLFVIGAAFPSFGQEQDSKSENESYSYYYGKAALATKSFSGSGLDENFGTVFGFKVGAGIDNNQKPGRIELGLGIFSKKSDKENSELTIFEFGIDYDLVLRLNKGEIYGKIGLIVTNYTVTHRIPLNKTLTEKASGVGARYGIGLTTKLNDALNLYADINLEDITGKDEEDLSAWNFNIGLRARL